ncbi:MAG: 6-carboxytetrahydropterin synthase [Melioribacter sp.]|uniref:6-pyruvoyl trahydropterin synthase family protein n=1 Tax=Rosettibacter primus TaxID=3111523 RepID=UPI00247EB6C1|nr:6-carboxytetrahydropterin synthase [Melioribacter sp.]
MKIAKEFTWEMGHRLTFHKGKCKNLHGHSYKCIIEINGTPDSNGMVLDYYDLSKIVNPVIDELDHSIMVYNEDKDLISALEKLNSKKVVVNFETTAENICYFLIDKIKPSLPENIISLKVRVLETENSYAEEEIKLK